MIVQFIFMTMAFVIMLIVAILQNRKIKKLRDDYQELYDQGWREYTGFGKLYRRNYKYIVIENAGDNKTLNDTAQRYHDEGYDLDREKTTDHLMVFAKNEEVIGSSVHQSPSDSSAPPIRWEARRDSATAAYFNRRI